MLHHAAFGHPARRWGAMAAAAALGARLLRGAAVAAALEGNARRAFAGAAAPALKAPERSGRYARLTDADVSALSEIVGGGSAVVTDSDELERYNVDWMRKYRGASRLALRPSDAQSAAAALRYCSDRRLAVVPQGGNTGLVGGSVPVFDEVVLSVSAMNAVESIDADTGVAVAQAGVVLETLDGALAEKGLMAPLDLGAKGTCMIGGNVSTNAGGLRLLRYGSLHGSVLGVEVALADGSVLDLMSENRKDTTGYDLKNLFVGAEGTLGVVTRVALQGAPRPAAVNVAWLACPSYAAVLDALREARASLGEVLSAFELIDSASLSMALAHQPQNRDPLPEAESPFYVLVETSGSVNDHDVAKLEAFVEAAVDSGAISDGVLASSARESAALWELREGISDALTARGGVHKYDVSLPLRDLYAMVDDCRNTMRVTGLEAEGVTVCGYGHCGDGNLHLNISAPGVDAARVKGALEPWVYEWVQARKGARILVRARVRLCVAAGTRALRVLTQATHAQCDAARPSARARAHARRLGFRRARPGPHES